MKQLLADLYNLFFPLYCQVCSQVLSLNEEQICLYCREEIPFARITDLPNNEVEQMLYGRVSVQFSTSLLYFERNGLAQELIHRLKYHGQQDLGTLFGSWLAEELKMCARFPSIDCVVPVPLSIKKMRKRGYNQVAKFGQKIAVELKVAYNDQQLLARHSKETQTKKGRLDRWANVRDRFHIRDPSFFNNKCILLIDDVITTGATLEACCRELKRAENVKICIATMAFTS